jgi:uncharacterized membrane protein YsdA (DUF1294 family)/cold shock CspA family protein
MRFTGTLKSWNDGRGFGFIEPSLGGQDIFVHVRACRVGGFRPKVGQLLTFKVEVNADGKKRAHSVELIRPARRSSPSGMEGPAQWGTASYFTILLFGLVFLIAAVAWRVPGWVGGFYLLASIVAFFAYAADKSAAASGKWRTSEDMLLFLGLAGGWPGAIVAQQILRHKSIKKPFRSAFWGTVIVNVLVFLFLSSPYMQAILGR